MVMCVCVGEGVLCGISHQLSAHQQVFLVDLPVLKVKWGNFLRTGFVWPSKWTGCFLCCLKQKVSSKEIRLHSDFDGLWVPRRFIVYNLKTLSHFRAQGITQRHMLWRCSVFINAQSSNQWIQLNYLQPALRAPKFWFCTDLLWFWSKLGKHAEYEVKLFWNTVL